MHVMEHIIQGMVVSNVGGSIWLLSRMYTICKKRQMAPIKENEIKRKTGDSSFYASIERVQKQS